MAIERELKYTLTRTEHKKVLDSIPRNRLRRVRQTNYYFDTPTLSLKRSRIGLRIRCEDGKSACVTLKRPAKARSGPKGFRARHEHDFKISVSLARRIISGKTAITTLDMPQLKSLKKPNLRCLGALQTIRHITPLKPGLRMEIDRSSCFGTTFFELEVETSSPVATDRLIRKRFERLGITAKPGEQSKLVRFFEAWKEGRRCVGSRR